MTVTLREAQESVRRRFLDGVNAAYLDSRSYLDSRLSQVLSNFPAYNALCVSGTCDFEFFGGGAEEGDEGPGYVCGCGYDDIEGDEDENDSIFLPLDGRYAHDGLLEAVSCIEHECWHALGMEHGEEMLGRDLATIAKLCELGIGTGKEAEHLRRYWRKYHRGIGQENVGFCVDCKNYKRRRELLEHSEAA